MPAKRRPRGSGSIRQVPSDADQARFSIGGRQVSRTLDSNAAAQGWLKMQHDAVNQCGRCASSARIPGSTDTGRGVRPPSGSHRASSSRDQGAEGARHADRRWLTEQRGAPVHRVQQHG